MITIILAAIAAWCPIHEPRCQLYAVDVDDAVSIASEASGVDKAVILAIAWVETGGTLRDDLVGGKGEIGPWQLLPGTPWFQRARMLCSSSLTRANCLIAHAFSAAELMRENRRWCGTERRALGAYNTGRCGGGARYADRVLGIARRWR